MNSLQAVMELREALALIHDFCLENSSAQVELTARLREYILRMDRRYGHIQHWQRSAAGPAQSGDPE